jgi:hypothetical protein
MYSISEKREVLLEPLDINILTSPYFKTCVSSCGHCRACSRCVDTQGRISLDVNEIRKLVREYKI